MALAFPWIVVTLWLPVPLSLSVDDKTITLEFASQEFEQEFKELNRISEDLQINEDEVEYPRDS